MKLIIDIPEWKYKSICEGVEASKRCGVVGIDPGIHEAIYNGTMLDSVKAEIKEKCDEINYIVSDLPYSKHRAIQELLCEILASIDKAESEVDQNETIS